MSEINFCLEFENLNDSELLGEMLTNDIAHSCIYMRHKNYCINFMMSRGASENDALDIYQDATIVLYEKIQNSGFRLTCSIQTYLNSVCYYQLLARAKSSYVKKILLTDDIDDSIQDWFETEVEENQEKINKILFALETLRIKGHKCFERLRLFYYLKLKNDEIAKRLNLQDADTVKNLIGRCRTILKSMVGVN